MKKLTEAEVTQKMSSLPEWKIQQGALCRTFSFADFVGSMRFVNGIADAAERADHHPDIDIRYSKVTLSLMTHDAGGITTKDFELAQEAEKLV